ncbi:MAG: EF-P beta-lysylation protein EpmB [Thermoguttaceae bacterium]
MIQSEAINKNFQSRPADWQAELACSVRDPGELCRLLGLPAKTAESAVHAADGYSMLVPRPFISRIQPGDPCDPLLLQVLPQDEELRPAPGFTIDPLDETAALCAGGLLWKYQHRILILTTPACGVHCRFCFRRHFPHQKNLLSPLQWDRLVSQIAAEHSLHEIILSGGDPLTLADDKLAQIAANLAKIPHVKRLRIHTRLPIMIPRRVGEEMLSWLSNTRLSAIMVLHINHPAEIDASVCAALSRLIDAGIPVLSQGVLLAGVNDRLEVLLQLYERLADLRVIPYYLHQLDPVSGAAHFETPVAKGKQLMAQLREKLPGYAVPRYVRENPGGKAKEILC